MNELTKIVIIEDNLYMRTGWKTILDFEPDMCVINTFDSYEAAEQSQVLSTADILLLDIQLPGMHGTEAVKIIRKKYPNLLVLMVTIHDDNDHIFTAIRNGAIGYLLKKVSPGELADAVRTAKAGGSPMSPNIARKVIASFQKTATDIELSEIEKKILELLASGNSYVGISKIVFLSVDGVRYHIRNIYSKLEAKNRSEAVSKGISMNLIKPENYS